MIKVVLFDLGNVILPVDGHRLAHKLTKHTTFSAQEILECFFHHEIINPFEKGEFTPDDFYKKVCGKMNLTGLEFAEFITHFNDIFDEDQNVIDLLAILKHNYKLGLISNTNQVHVEHMTARYELFKHFDELWFSNEAGLRKPDPAIYRLAIEHFGVNPREMVFVDDLKPNIEGAESLGINGILFKSYEQLVRDLDKLGVITKSTSNGKAA